MINRIRAALDKIECDDKTKSSLCEEVLQKLGPERRRLRVRAWRRTAASIAASLAVVAGISAAAWMYFFMPLTDVGIDMGSVGVQLRLSRAGRVIDFYCGGADGELDVKGMDLSRAVSEIISASGSEDSSSPALAVVFACSDGGGGAGALLRKVKNEITRQTSEKGVSAAVYSAEADAEMLSSAKALGVTLGKYYLIRLVQAVDGGSSESELALYGADSLAGIFTRAFSDSGEDITSIEDDPAPLAPGPGETQAEARVSEEPDREEVARQYAILSALIND